MSFVLYRSSAGSGKTYTLVKEYLSLVLEDPLKFKHILAVTFTNKAAAEMKERILQALKDLKKGVNKDLEQALKQENPKLGNIRVLSAELLTRLLHNYSDFAIMTIDSFTHKVLRAFALELGLPLTFAIDLNYDRLNAFVVETLIGQVGVNHHITTVLLSLVYDRINQGRSWNIEKDIKGFVGDLFNEKNADWAAEIHQFGAERFESYRQQLNAYRSSFIHKMVEKGTHASKAIKDAGFVVEDFYQAKRGPAGLFEKAMTWDDSDLPEIKLNSYFRNEEKWASGKKKKAEKIAIEKLADDELAQIRRAMIEYFDGNYPVALTAHYMLENLFLAAIIGEIKQYIEIYKKQNNVVPISEFNIKVHEIVTHSPVPFIYEMIGERFNHYLIDEFQDTSRMQWDNLTPLLDNALASGYFNMAVGDGKQSIYRWRGGDVKIMETDIKDGILGEHLSIENLGRNFRSRWNIVDFNNRFFKNIGPMYGDQNRLLRAIYKDVSQSRGTTPVNQKNGLVSLQLITDVSKKSEADPIVFDKVNTIVKQCLEEYGFRQRDIAVLVRSKKEGSKIALNLLEQDKGYKIVSPDSLVLAKIPLIRFLVDVLTFLNNPDDTIAGSAVIYYISLNKKEGALDPEIIGDFFLNFDSIDEHLLPELNEFFTRSHDLIRLPVYEVLEEVIRIFRLQESLGFETSGYLQAFLEIVAHYSAENNVDFASFLEWWQSNEEAFALEVPEDVDAIKIMTIHKAKGLEFPVVIIPYADWEHELDRKLWLRPDAQFKLDPPLGIPMPVRRNTRLKETLFATELAEEEKRVAVDNINLLYVAFTRAGDHLYIIAQAGQTNYKLLKELAVPMMEQQENEDHFLLGEPVREPDTGVIIPDQSPGELLSTRWYDKISIRRNAEEFWRFDSNYRDEKRRWGILVHQVLSRINSISDIPAVIQSITTSGDIAAHQQEILKEQINGIFQMESVRRWFDPSLQVFNESPIITDDGIMRPDRVVMDDDKVVIVDFKTGGKHNSHSWQLLKYKQAIMEMGYKNVECYILYIPLREIVEV